MKSTLVSSFIMTLFMTRLAFAHGENVPGPHGGYIKMPGAFHTELVPADKDTVRVYLLDMAFKNPSVKDAKVEGKLRSKEGVDMLFSCSQEKDFFLCKLPAPISSHAGGQLVILAEREGQKGIPTAYDLPLKRGS